MPKTLTIKNVPEPLLADLRERARANHRSLQGELMHIITAAVHQQDERTISLRAFADEGRAMGLSTPSQSTRWLREDRDER